MGGFARRMSYWNAFAGKYPNAPVVRVDGGSIFNVGVADGPVRNRWMLEGTFRSRLDAVNLTAWDVPVWQEMADLAAAGVVPREHLGVPLVSANVTPKIENFPKLERFRLRDLAAGAGGAPIRVGITGLLFDPQERLSRREFAVVDPQTAARQVVSELKEKTDYRVILTDLDLGRAISLAIAVPDVDLIVVARNYESVVEPQQIGDTLIVVPINEGRTVGEVRVQRARGIEKRQVDARFAPLDRTVPDDPALGDLVRKAQAELDEFRKKNP